eukprot:3682637-Amphidinium_carterae.2
MISHCSLQKFGSLCVSGFSSSHLQAPGGVIRRVARSVDPEGTNSHPAAQKVRQQRAHDLIQSKRTGSASLQHMQDNLKVNEHHSPLPPLFRISHRKLDRRLSGMSFQLVDV